MPSIPDFSDILLVIILLVPGFGSFLIARKIGFVESKLGDYENTIISLMLSLVNYIPFALITGLTDLTKIRDNIFVPSVMLTLLAITPLTGITAGVIIRFILKRGRKEGTLWNRTLRLMGDETYILVITESGYEYKGYVKYHSFSSRDAANDDKELIILNPFRIIRNSDGSVKENRPMGKGILFVNSDIKHLVFLEEEPIKGKILPTKSTPNLKHSVRAIIKPMPVTISLIVIATIAFVMFMLHASR